MRFLRFTGFLALMLFTIGSVQAQSDMAETLGINIDNSVQLAGFPTTGS